MDNILIAPKGYRYTNGKDYGRRIALGKDASESDWWLITEEEYQEIKAKEREAYVLFE